MAKDYLKYTIKFGDILLQYMTKSCMEMDDIHRRKQAEEQEPIWDVGPHTMVINLEKRPKQQPKSQTPSKGGGKQTPKQCHLDRNGKEIFINYNQPSVVTSIPANTAMLA